MNVVEEERKKKEAKNIDWKSEATF